jgi:hypothetical protein
MNPWPFIVVGWAVAVLVICRWMAAAKAEDSTYIENP